MPERIRVLLLGGSGFVGRALRRSLAAAGRCDVVAPASSELDLCAEGAAEKLAALLTPDTVLVCATQSKGGSGAPEGALREETMAAALARALGLRKVRQLVYCSSLSVYGDAATDLAIDESTPAAPTSPYGRAKLAAEGILSEACARVGVPLLVLRPCKIYGPGGDPRSYGPAGFVESILGAGEVVLYGDGGELRDHLFIDDFCAAVAGLVAAGRSGVFVAGSGRSHSYLEMVELLRGISRREVRVTQRPRTRPRVDQGVRPRRLQEALPGLALTGLEEGLRRLWGHASAGRAPAAMPCLVSFFVPALNEEGNVGRTIDRIAEVMRPRGKPFEIIVVDDASADGTAAEAEGRRERHPEAAIALVRNRFCRGIGRNYFIAAHRARGEYFMLVNGDAAEPAESIAAILDHMGEADAVVPYFGLRETRTLARRSLSRTFTALVNLLSGHRLRYYNGPVLHRTENVRSWFSETAGFGYQAELLCRLLDEGISVTEVQITNNDRERGASKALRLGSLLSVSNSLFHIFLRRLQRMTFDLLAPPRLPS